MNIFLKLLLPFLIACFLASGSLSSARAIELGASEGEGFASAYSRDFNLPQLGDPADTALSPTQESQLGAQVVAQLYAYEYLLEDPQITEYLTSTGWKLAEASNTDPEHLQFFVVKDSRINAFALPGGYMGFNAGLITASSTESELVGVMAHELAHVTQRHIARSQTKGGGLATIATWGAVLAAIIAGSADPNIVLAALGIGQTLSYQRQVAFTRAHELEADRIGIQTLSDAGYDTAGMAGFFQKLEQQSRLYGTGIPEFLRTHPINTTRISEAKTRAASLPQREIEDSLEYRLIRARTQVYASGTPSSAVSYFSALIASGKDSAETRYGRAFAMSRLGRYDDALKEIDQAREAHPRQLNIQLLVAQLQLDSGNDSLALELFERALTQHPRSSSALYAYADALIRAGKGEVAREKLLESNPAFGVQPESYRLLSLAARQMRDNAEASYQMATYLYLRGDPGGALAQLDAGLRLRGLQAQEVARLEARRAEIRQTLPRNWKPEHEREERRRY